MLAPDGSDFSSLDILKKIFPDCVIETKDKADEHKGAVKMFTTLCESEKILAIMERGLRWIKSLRALQSD